MVRIVDHDGQPVKVGAKQLLKVKELATVVVRGKAQRVEGGNLTVLATGIYIRP